MNLPKFDRSKLNLAKLKSVASKLLTALDHWFDTCFSEFAVDCVRVAFMLGLFYLFIWIISSPAPADGETTVTSLKLSYSLTSDGPYAKTLIIVLYGLFVFCFGMARKLRFSFRKDPAEADKKDKEASEVKESATEAANSAQPAAPAEAVAAKAEPESTPAKPV